MKNKRAGRVLVKAASEKKVERRCESTQGESMKPPSRNERKSMKMKR
jgi:hypothetical protein